MGVAGYAQDGSVAGCRRGGTPRYRGASVTEVHPGVQRYREVYRGTEVQGPGDSQIAGYQTTLWCTGVKQGISEQETMLCSGS